MKICSDFQRKKELTGRHWPKVINAAAVAAAAVSTAIYSIYRYGFYSPRGKQNDDYHILIPMSKEQHDYSVALIDRLNSRQFEKVFIRSFDGLTLAGRYFHVRDNSPLAILCHGYRGTPSRDFCGGADICFNMGMNVLMIEERAHCSSEGHTITFGVKERYDIRSWVQYAVNRFGQDLKILLVGISMGGGTVLMASDLALPSNVRGIIADCPFTSPQEMIMEFGRKNKLPMKVLYPLTALAARVFGNFSLKAADAVTSVRHTKLPILIIHGEADGLVPCEMSRRIAEANPSLVVRYTFPNAVHGLSYLVDPPRYTALVNSFCERIFGES